MAVTKTKTKAKSPAKAKIKSGNIPSHATFTLTLNKVYGGGAPVIRNAKCEFSYIWDFDKNMGLAHLISIDNCVLNITMNPIGLAGILGFMAAIPPTPVVINGQRVVLYRIILNIYKNDGVRAAAVMFNNDGSCIEITDSWRIQAAAGLGQ